MGERSDIEQVLGELLRDAPTGRKGTPDAPALQWQREELAGKPGEPVLHVFRPPPGVHLRLDLDG